MAVLWIGCGRVALTGVLVPNKPLCQPYTEGLEYLLVVFDAGSKFFVKIKAFTVAQSKWKYLLDLTL